MNEELDMIFEDASERMDNSISHFERALTKLRAGKASPVMLEGVMVDYYGTPTALDKVANVMCPDPMTKVSNFFFRALEMAVLYAIE